MLCLDLLTALASLGIYSIVYIDELAATSWEECDEGRTINAGVDNFLEVVVAIGYLLAFAFEGKESTETAAGLAYLTAAAMGGVITKGVKFRLEYEKL